MQKVTITKQSQQLIAANARRDRPVRLVGGRDNGDGTVTIELSEEVLAHLRMLDEDIDRAIALACTQQYGRA